jgi:hypothetical protein
MELFGRELTFEQLRGFVEAQEKDGEVKMPKDWVLELIDKAQEYEKENNLKIETMKISEMNNILEPLKVESALRSQALTLEYRRSHKPDSINELDYTIIMALVRQLPMERLFDGVDTYMCPACKEEVYDEEYCPYCGQRMLVK